MVNLINYDLTIPIMSLNTNSKKRVFFLQRIYEKGCLIWLLETKYDNTVEVA